MPVLEMYKRIVTKHQIEQLIEKLVKLEFPNREIDAEVAWAFGWEHRCNTRQWGIGAPHWYLNGKSASEVIGYWYNASGSGSHLPFFTTSMDAALSTLPTWLTPTIIGHDREVRLLNGIGMTVGGSDYLTHASSLVCGVVAASLKYKLATDEEYNEDGTQS